MLPGGLLVLVLLFGVYALSKTRELAELRGLVHGLEQRVTATPSVAQLEKLFDMVSRSQLPRRRSTPLRTCSSPFLDGKIIAANRSFALSSASHLPTWWANLWQFLDRTCGAAPSIDAGWRAS